MNFRYPIFLDLTGKKCVVTGEGFEIAVKVRALLAAAATVTYVHPSAEPVIEELANKGSIHWERRDFMPGDLDGCFLVITDLDDNSEVFKLAEARNVLCNAVDDPPNCRFSFGSIHRQGDLSIAVSTNGRAPAVAVRLRQWLEREIGPEYGDLLRLMKEFRPQVNGQICDFDARKELWYKIVDSDVLNLLREGKEPEAARQIQLLIEEAISSILHSRTSSGNDPR